MRLFLFFTCLLIPTLSFADITRDDTESFVYFETQSDSDASVIDILVYANSAVDDLCNYFNDSWANTALTIYCSFGGDMYTCTAYKVVQAACTVNGAVKLMIEGDASAALKKMISGATKIYSVSKVSDKFYIKD